MKKFYGLMIVAGLSVGSLQAQVKLSERLTKIAGHLGEGGVHFSVTDTEDDIRAMGKMVDQFIGQVPDSGVPPGFKVETVFDELGLLSLQGRGSSSHQIGASWHNRTFLLTDGKHEGLLSLLGEKSKEPAAVSFAPAGADLVLETSLNLRGVEKSYRSIAKLVGGDLEENLVTGFKEDVFDLGISFADLFADFTVRGTLVLWLDEEKTFEAEPGLVLPVPHFVARLENAGMVWEIVEEELKDGSKIEEKDGEVVLTPENGPQGTPFGQVLPQIVWNPESKVLFFSLSAEDLASCRSDGPKVTGDESYRKATADFPKELSAFAYVSGDVFKLVESLVKKMEPQIPEEAAGFVKGLMPHVEMLAKDGGYALGVAVEDEGFLALANLPFPLKSDTFVGPGGVAGVAVLAGLATPAILKAKNKADQVKAMNDLKQLGVLLSTYELEYSRYPAQLREIIKAELIGLEGYRALSFDQVVYLPGAAPGDPANRIMAYRETPESDHVLVLHLNGSVHSLPAEVVEMRLREQRKK